jgi:HAD superfamily hydrolase (TIGR01509 family)
MKKKGIKGIIFDMDGVIIDSNGIHYQNWNRYFEGKFNITIDKVEFASHLGESAIDFTKTFVKRYNLTVSPEEALAEILSYYGDAHALLKKGAKEILPLLHREFRIALATGANREYAAAVLKETGILNHFDFVIAGNEVKQAKPSPEIFLKAANGLHLLPHECIVIEDADHGLKAAKSAGMRCIILEDEFTKHQLHKGADLKISELSELNKKMILKVGNDGQD